MAAVSIQFTPRSRARWMAAMDSLSSLRSPGEFPIAAADGPGTEADRGKVEIGISKGSQLRSCGS